MPGPKLGTPKTHGHAVSGKTTPTYRTWESMRYRCRADNTPYWHLYKGAGIKVCKRWQVFANFLNDMGLRPEGKTIDRINNFKDYKPSNCRWATPAEQTHNIQRKPIPKIHCRRGHELTKENIYMTPSGYRCCRKCTRLRWHLRKSALQSYEKEMGSK